CTVAFSRPDPAVFRVGLHGDEALGRIEWLQPDYIERVPFDDLERAIQRVQHHQIDLLLSADGRYWFNTESGRSRALLQLLRGQLEPRFRPEQISGRPVRYVDWVLPGVIGMNMMFGAL